MKVLLALLLLFFFNSVFSQEDYVPCSTLERCPKGYTVLDSGRTQQKAACICRKDKPELSQCSISAMGCRTVSDSGCINMESKCSPTEIISICNTGSFPFPVPEICDRANQQLTKDKYAINQLRCENSKNDCIKRGGYSCPSAAASCEPDTTVQMCKDGNIYSHDICEAAEIQKEKDRAENTKYSCDYSQELCLTNKTVNICSDITKFCHPDTAAKWCYKDDTNQIEKISDEDCSRVVKKSQDLMFGKSNEECWKQVPLCEGGDSEACMQVPTLCVKEIVSALCNAKKITSKRICTYAGSEKATSFPGCDFFSDKCIHEEGDYCSLASRYCDNHTIGFLCGQRKITDRSFCKRVSAAVGIFFRNPIISTIQWPDGFGF